MLAVLAWSVTLAWVAAIAILCGLCLTVSWYLGATTVERRLERRLAELNGSYDQSSRLNLTPWHAGDDL